MVEKLGDVWFSRDLPVLLEVVRRVDSGERHPEVHRLPEATGLIAEDCQLALHALQRTGYLDIVTAHGGHVINIKSVSGRAYTIAGLHPDGDDIADRLVSALRQAAEQTADEEDRSTLRKAARYVADIPRDIAVGVVSAVISGQV